MGEVRTGMLTRIGWIPGLLLCGILIGRSRIPRELLALVGGLALSYVLLEWGGEGAASTWAHTSPFALPVLWTVVCALGVSRWRWAVVPHAAVFVGLWLLAPPVV